MAADLAELVADRRDGRNIEPAVLREDDALHVLPLVLDLVDLVLLLRLVHRKPLVLKNENPSVFTEGLRLARIAILAPSASAGRETYSRLRTLPVHRLL
jgi:hypothetical protein